MSYITIFTDASYCQKTNIASWAAYIRYGAGLKFEIAKSFKETHINSTESEIKAIGNSIAVALKLITPEVGDIILVQSDCQPAIDFIANNIIHKRKKTAELRRISEVIRKMIPVGVQLKFKKVQAHSKKEGARYYCNKVVDKASRKIMRSTRKEVSNFRAKI